MTHFHPYVMQTGSPLAGWLTIIFAVGVVISGYCAFIKKRK